MSAGLCADLNMNSAFEDLFRAEYAGLLRYASAVFRQRSGSINTSKAEEAVGELFALAWSKRDVLFSSEKPVGWLYRALYYIILGMLQKERRRAKVLALLQNEYTGSICDVESLELSFQGIVPTEDLKLLERLYIEGYTYQELTRKFSMKKSTLAMRVYRIKEKMRTELSKDRIS